MPSLKDKWIWVGSQWASTQPERQTGHRTGHRTGQRTGHRTGAALRVAWPNLLSTRAAAAPPLQPTACPHVQKPPADPTNHPPTNPPSALSRPRHPTRRTRHVPHVPQAHPASAQGNPQNLKAPPHPPGPPKPPHLCLSSSSNRLAHFLDSVFLKFSSGTMWGLHWLTMK